VLASFQSPHLPHPPQPEIFSSTADFKQPINPVRIPSLGFDSKDATTHGRSISAIRHHPMHFPRCAGHVPNGHRPWARTAVVPRRGAAHVRRADRRNFRHLAQRESLARAAAKCTITKSTIAKFTAARRDALATSIRARRESRGVTHQHDSNRKRAAPSAATSAGGQYAMDERIFCRQANHALGHAPEPSGSPCARRRNEAAERNRRRSTPAAAGPTAI
jgi:hypothetical protein